MIPDEINSIKEEVYKWILYTDRMASENILGARFFFRGAARGIYFTDFISLESLIFKKAKAQG